MTRQATSPVAIIGMAFRLPGDLGDEASLWDALCQKRDLITRVPEDRWAVDTLEHRKRSEPGRSITFSAGVLSRIDEFDAEFFGISPREAAWLDPQQRLLLELAWEAMENAHVLPSSVAGTDCAVYVGISSLDYGTRGLDDLASMSSHSMTGNTLSIAANRLSFAFDLHGPSLAVDTACSSSLVALHHACRALQAGEAGQALVASVNLLLHPYPFVGFTKASMLSADGRCKAFDASGNGYVRAEGGAVLLLKPLDQAIADGDDIQAVILASGTNADGARKSGITIPSSAGQAELMKSVLAKTRLSPRDIDFVEAHGTGTAIGDPVEAAAIGAVYGQGREKPLPIGSIKANLGHLEPASGMAGMVKAILALRHRALPPQLHLAQPNPQIDFTGLNIAPVAEYLELVRNDGGPLVAGVNSFGFGGANAHVLLQEYRRNAVATPKPAVTTLPPLLLSARSDAALRALAGRYAARLQGCSEQDYYDIAHAAADGRERLERRLALCADSVSDARERLAACAAGETPDGIVLETALPEPGGIAFIYSGNGSQWLGMGRRLLAESERFGRIFAELDERMQPVAGFSVLRELQAEEDAARLADTVVAQPLLFALQVGLTQLLEEQGVVPAAVTGHSVGELAAAWACGALDLDTAIRVIVARSRAQGETRGAGRMAAAGMSAAAMQALLAEQDEAPDIVIGGINSPGSITLSGNPVDLQRIGRELEANGIFFRMLDLDYAFHSRHMDPVREALLDSLAGLEPRAATRASYVSTVSGEVLDGERLDADYWWRNVREPVRFADAVTTLVGLGCRVFIEIGSHAILQRYISDGLNASRIRGRVLPSLRKNDDGASRLREVAMRALLLAASPTLQLHFPEPGGPVRLPNYPWQRERHWHPRTSEGLRSFERHRVHPLLGWRLPGGAHVWENILDPLILPWLADHDVGGAIVFPGAAFVEMALAAAREWIGGERLAFEEFDIVAPLVFDGEQARTLQLELDGRDGSFWIRSRVRLSADEWTLHAAGRLLEASSSPFFLPISSVADVAHRLDGEDLRRLASMLGLDYGPAFRGLDRITVDGDLLQGELLDDWGLPAEGYLIHPAVLDVCYQSVAGFFQREIEAGQGAALLPVRTARFVHHRCAPVRRFRAALRRRNARSMLVDFELLDADGGLVASLSGCRFRAALLVHGTSGRIPRWRIVPWLQPHPVEALSIDWPRSRELVGQLPQERYGHPEARQAWFREALPLFEALVVSFAFEAVQALLRKDRDALARLMHSADGYAEWLLGLLRQEGLLVEDAGTWSLTKNGNLPAAEEIWRTLLCDHPACLPQLVLLGSIGRQLPQLLSGERDRLEFLERLRRSPVAEALYEEDPVHAGVSHATGSILRQLAHELPPRRRLRVLEIAAGSSELPRGLLAELAEDRLDYVLALPDEAAVGRQQAEYAMHANLVVVRLDPVTWQLQTDRALPALYDVVVIRHALHRAQSPRAVLNQAKRWLAVGGALFVAERHPDWAADLLGGLDPAWWHRSAAGDSSYSSLATPATWTEILEAEGFGDVLDLGEPAAGGIEAGAYLLLARGRQREPVPLAVPEAAGWLLLVDAASQRLAMHLASRLEALGQRIEMHERLPAQGIAGFEHIVHLRGWEAPPESAGLLVAEALGDVQTLGALHGTAPRLWFVTRGGAVMADHPAEARTSSPAQAALWGFGRVVMNEHPGLRCTLIDLACTPDAADAVPRLENELLYPDGATEVVLADAGRHLPVLCEAVGAGVAAVGEPQRFRLDFQLPGKLRNLLWFAQDAPSLRESEIEVQVRATGLNFRDVMYVMGLLPDEAVERGFAGASLGLEFAGIVSRTGSRVRDLQVGDKVMGFGSACFASHVVTRSNAVALMPEDWSFDAAATVPTAFFTAYYALSHLAGLQPGERVLVHGGAGGVGIAAIQLARHLGAEIFATAGSEEKRDFVRLLGADHVLDSRSLDFADEVLAATDGEGVDIILNSVAGEAIRRNLRVLKPFGRFLELGKRDFFENTPVGLRPFKDNISYFGIDADQLLTGRPQLATRLFRELMALFREGAITPLPCRVFDTAHVVDAFRLMQQARHIGKVVVSLEGAQPVLECPAAVPEPLQLAPESTWLVTGGLSGFGLESARWLAAHGVRHLVLAGRRGLETPGARDAIVELAGRGVVAEAFACDLADERAVARLIEHIRNNCPSLKGVVHAAAVFDDALLQQLDAVRVERVISPKLVGAWNLHQATLDIPLEHFVLYSSVTTAIGNPGQANYVAANAGLEGLAAMRRQMGLPAACIGWGPIGDAGYLTRNDAVRDSLAQRLGRPPLGAREALEQLDSVLREESAVAIADFEWNTLARLLPSASGSRFLLLNRKRKDGGLSEDETDFRELIAGKPLDEVVRIVEQMVTIEVAQILAIDAGRVDAARSLHEQGLDSLMAVELALGLEQRLGIQLPVMLLNEAPTVEKVARHIVERLTGLVEEAGAGAPSLDAVTQDLARQHGESVTMDDMQQIVDDARALTGSHARIGA